MKCLISDYDGTITKMKTNIISNKDKLFLQEWQQENSLVVVSGKMISEFKNELSKHQISPNFYITNSGAIIYNDELNVIKEFNIDLELRDELMEKLAHYVNDYSIGYNIFNIRNSLSHSFTKDIDETSYFDAYAPKENRLESGFHDIKQNENLNSIQFFINHNDMESLLEELKNKFDKFAVFKLSPNIIQINSINASKENASKYIIELLKISLNDVYTAGNDINDLGFMSLSNNSFAINPLNDEMKKQAKYTIQNIHKIKDLA